MSTYPVGSLVEFRGREWVVMPASEKDVISLRPLTGHEEDICSLYSPIDGSKLNGARFPLPNESDLGDFESARLLRDATCLLLRRGASPFRSFGYLSFRPRPYQLVPLLMALRLNPVRMLIADDVGIGKTIEAGLVARELLDRGDVSRLAVLCPPYLCDQWQRELSQKFHIDAKIVRTNTLARLERDLPRPNLSVFEYYKYLVLSIDFIKSQRRRDAFLVHAPDLVIVDEAHGCSRPAGQSVTKQQRHELIHDLASEEDKNLILVTATPHSGIEETFLSLLGFISLNFGRLDLSTIEKDERKKLANHFIQRSRRDVEQWMGTETKFPKRDPIEVSYALSQDYKKLFMEVFDFAREMVVVDTGMNITRKRVRHWAALALLRCVMSSPLAAQAALKARLERLRDRALEEEIDYTADVYDPTDSDTTTDVVPSHVIRDESIEYTETEAKKLIKFARDAEAIKGANDTKIQKATDEIRGFLKQGFKPIIFCRFIATADYVAGEIRNRLKKEFKSIHVLSITGALTEEEREIQIKELAGSNVRVLVATDCMSEGINLQEDFNAVLHYDLPWNPNRLEQREGRVDRFGQRASIVKAVILYGADNPIDGAVLNVLLRKAKKIHETLGITVPIPTDSESVMEAVFHALFMRGDRGDQLGLFDHLPPVEEVHRKWDRAADHERRSRTLFAQHSIKPGEVAKELEACDSVLGSPDIVERFVRTSMQRLNCPLAKQNGSWVIDVSSLPRVLQDKIKTLNRRNIVFDQPDREGLIHITRNHTLVNALSEYVFSTAFHPEGDRSISARCSVIRSKDVHVVLIFLILRPRYLIEMGDNQEVSIAEECVVVGFKGEVGNEDWMGLNEAKHLFDHINPTSNVNESDKKYWLGVGMKHFSSIDQKMKEIANLKSTELSESFQNVSRVIREGQTKIRPFLPMDLLAISVVLPEPRV